MIEWFEEALRHKDFARTFDGIVDLRRADLARLTLGEVKALAAGMIRKEFTTGRWVHLTNDPAGTALSMVYGRLAGEQHPVEIFSTIESAAVFLGREPSKLDALLESMADAE